MTAIVTFTVPAAAPVRVEVSSSSARVTAFVSVVPAGSRSARFILSTRRTKVKARITAALGASRKQATVQLLRSR